MNKQALIKILFYIILIYCLMNLDVVHIKITEFVENITDSELIKTILYIIFLIISILLLMWVHWSRYKRLKRIFGKDKKD